MVTHGPFTVHSQSFDVSVAVLPINGSSRQFQPAVAVSFYEGKRSPQQLVLWLWCVICNYKQKSYYKILVTNNRVDYRNSCSVTGTGVCNQVVCLFCELMNRED